MSLFTSLDVKVGKILIQTSIHTPIQDDFITKVHDVINLQQMQLISHYQCVCSVCSAAAGARQILLRVHLKKCSFPIYPWRCAALSVSVWERSVQIWIYPGETHHTEHTQGLSAFLTFMWAVVLLQEMPCVTRLWPAGVCLSSILTDRPKRYLCFMRNASGW